MIQRRERFTQWCDKHGYKNYTIDMNRILFSLEDEIYIVISFPQEVYASIYFQDSDGEVIFIPYLVTVDQMRDEDDLHQYISDILKE